VRKPIKKKTSIRSSFPLHARTHDPERWNLSDLVDHPVEHLDRLTKELDGLVSQFESLRSQLLPDLSGGAFLEVLQLSEDIARFSGKLSAFSYLWFAEDTQNPQARSFKSIVEERLTALHNRMLFFDLWWQSLDSSTADRLKAGAGDYAYYLDSIRRYTRHTLSEPEEKIINLKNVTGRQTVHTIYDVLTNGFKFSLNVSGKKRTLTREQLSSYVRNPKRTVREAAYRELFRIFAGSYDVVGEIYAALVKDWKAENIELRKFGSPIAARNLGNDVPDEAVNALLSVCGKNADVFQEYFRLKGRILNIKHISRYDIYAPHHADRKRYRYSDAVSMVLRAYRGFSPRLSDLAEKVFAERHIDVRNRTGKLSGAFCYSVTPELTPYVMLNYTGEARDVATLAHELGHAVHAMMAAQHTVFTFHATLPLAETASVFGERILSDALMGEERDTAVKQGLLLTQLDDIYATVMRQAYFVRFEQSAHNMVAKGATARDLSEVYLADLRQQFGKSVTVPDQFRWEWLTIPHIFASPFYCYAYSFGNLLVLALYQQYRRQGEAFIPKYLELLAAGGSRNPDAVLSELGVNIRSEGFWQAGFDTIEGILGELERTLH